MQSVSNLGRTLVVVLATVISGSSLMFAALGPGLTQTASAQVAVTQQA
jgi:hypothetical protein